MKRLTAALCATVITAGLCAQTTNSVSPSNTPNSNNNFPFNYQPARYMQVHDASGFTIQTPLVLAGMDYAPYATTTNSGTVEVMVQLSLAATGITSVNAVSGYDNNVDASTTRVVIARKKINISGGTVGNFVANFPFDANASFPWIPSQQRSLCVETRVYSGTVGYAFLAWSGLNLNNGNAVTNGSYAGCPSASNQTVTNNSITAYLKPDGQFGTNNYFYGYSYAPSVPGVFTLGATTLNISLPGTTCMVVNDIILLLAGITDTTTNGQLRINFPIPFDPRLVGVQFLTQMLYFEAAANTLGITTSRGLLNTLGKGMIGEATTVCRIYAFSSNPDTITAGSVGRHFGLVTQFHN